MVVLILEARHTIYLNSPQDWDASKVSKHHYARELCGRGHRVFFIEPPRPMTLAPPRLRRGPHDGLTIVTYGTFFPYRLKFHSRPIFDRLMAVQARRLVRAIGVRPDIVWDFDNATQYADLRVFGPAFRIFHPVDDIPRWATDKHADLVLSNAQRYIDRIKPAPARSAVIDHGLSEEFIALANRVIGQPNLPLSAGQPIIGYVGNLDRPGIDWQAVAAIAKAEPEAQMLLIGPFGKYGSGPPDAVKSLPNVTFTGPKTQHEIIEMTPDIDLWLMAYDRKRDIDGGTNPHKILEYLATGKAVVSNWAEAYVGRGLIAMPPTEDNGPLPALVSDGIARLKDVNAPAEQVRRARHALDYSYDRHLRRIDALIETASLAAPAATSHKEAV